MDIAHRLLHARPRGSGPALVAGLRVLLWWLGHGLALASRFSAAVRSQITRSLTVEISTDDGVARHWVFDSRRRLVSVRPGRAEAPDLAVRFTSSGQALRALTSPRAIDRIMGDLMHGAVRIEGSAMILVWFHGLTRKLVAVGRTGPRRRALPGAYLAHDPASNGAEKITIEPAVRQLDPRWTGAWNSRAKLWIVRGANGEPLREP
ncbi:hypothetical protein AB0L65_59635 [Nonomuraea sp. NPDC052116]|uniref:hypothetical protein n=1 Tax=Nonomuraea sp. NPDC052116 TaxID=3155665 RepID=UPI00344357FC